MFPTNHSFLWWEENSADYFRRDFESALAVIRAEPLAKESLLADVLSLIQDLIDSEPLPRKQFKSIQSISRPQLFELRWRFEVDEHAFGLRLLVAKEANIWIGLKFLCKDLSMDPLELRRLQNRAISLAYQNYRKAPLNVDGR